MGGADQGHHLDLLAPVLHRQTDGVAHHQQHAQPKQYPQRQGQATPELGQLPQTLDPGQVEAYLGHPGHRRQALGQRRHGLR